MKVFSNIRNKKSEAILKNNLKTPVKRVQIIKRKPPTPIRKINDIWQEKIPSKINLEDSIFKMCSNYGQCLEIILNLPPRQKMRPLSPELTDFFKLQSNKLKATLSELPETIGEKNSIETIAEHISNNLSSELSDANKITTFMKKMIPKKDTKTVKISGIDLENT